MFFEGTPEGMVKAMDTVRGLPDDTKLFVGHEYTLPNMEFCQKTEGESNPKIGEFLEKYTSLLNKGDFTVPSILRDEKLYNVFMRCREPELQEAMGEKDPAKLMHLIRE